MKGTSLPTGAALALATIAVAFGFRLAPSFSGGGAPCGGPYTISDFQTTVDLPGLWCVTNDIDWESPDPPDGIKVTASGVVIDLNGFRLDGKGGGTSAISSGNQVHDITVRNGAISAWTGDAIDLGGERNCAQNLEVGTSGAVRLGQWSRVERVQVLAGTGDDGFALGAHALVRFSQAFSGAGAGFTVGLESLVEDCMASDNESFQFNPSSKCRLVDCVARGGAGGFWARNDSHLTRCIVSDTTFVGISAESRVTFVDCHVLDASSEGDDPIGIRAGPNNRVIRCLVEEYGTGFAMGTGSIASDCTAEDCTVDGFAPAISFPGPFRVQDCLALGNGANGILATGESEILCTTSSGNILAGIRIDGDRARIESNRVLENGTGIRIVGVDNLVIQNSLGANGTPLAIPYGNTMGQLITTNSWVQSGSPWANFNLTFPN